MIEFDEEKQEKKVKDLYKAEEEELAQMLATKFGLAYVNFSFVPINSDALRIIDEKKARDAKIVAYNKVDKRLDVAVLSPQNEAAVQVVKELAERGYNVTIAVCSMDSLNRAWVGYKDLSFAAETKAGSLEVSNEEINEFLQKVNTVEDIKKYIMDILGQSKGYRISKIFEIILAGALNTGASDIHIEPEEEYVRLRYRLDGVLNNVLSFDRETYALLLSRIKLLSGLKLNIKSDAQDGRLSVKIDNKDIEIRTSILPGAYSESIVLRILNPDSIAVSLEELGMDAKLLEVVLKEISKPNGMLLTTGPTGSGKTTTLYAFLKKVHTSDIKIITIEDPIEYHLPGVVQTQTDSEKGYTFLQGLRASLRQDPDVIMVGEIRDHETAEIAVNAALTGHLVFSTLHTNNAAGAFPRLTELGVDPKIMVSAVTLAMAQRLVRKLCTNCKKEATFDEKQKALFEKIIAGIYDKSYVIPVEKHWTAGGCEKCNNTGYKGRLGIYEAIARDQALEQLLVTNPSEREIKKVTHTQGLLDMRQDGILKILKGITSIEELSRVVDLEEDI